MDGRGQKTHPDCWEESRVPPGDRDGSPGVRRPSRKFGSGQEKWEGLVGPPGGPRGVDSSPRRAGRIGSPSSRAK